VRAYVLVDGFASDNQDPKFIAVILGLDKQMQTDRPRSARSGRKIATRDSNLALHPNEFHKGYSSERFARICFSSNADT